MGKFIDLTDQQFDRLTVIKRVEDHIQPNGVKVVMWLCKCKCGNEFITSGISLRKKRVKSCGCYHKECAQKRGCENKKNNLYDLSGDYGIGYTFNGNTFLFDKEDYNLIKDYCWFINEKGYVVANPLQKEKEQKHKLIRFHRLILDAHTNFQVDHINHRKNDNRKENLRLVTNSQNSMNRSIQSNNTSGVTGVSYYNDGWNSEIHVNNEKIYLGKFNNIEDAIKARKDAETKYFGEYSYDNSIKQQESII